VLPTHHRGVLPRALYDQARRESREAFGRAFEDAALMAVRVDGLGDELVSGLEECFAEATGVWLPRSGATGMRTMVTPITDGFLRAVKEAWASDGATGATMRTLLTTGRHFFTPLRKRTGLASPERLTIGRSRTNDVTLRHRSVSKSHAWLELDEDGSFYLCDLGSTNTTQLNGHVLDSNVLERVHLGDRIRFGEVETTLCTAETLWDALQSEPVIV
jgi:hypothetical protein